jgi:uncharacterized protein (DUF433 family)
VVSKSTIATFGSTVSTDPNICHGKPHIAGTRVPVSVIIGYLAGGESVETTADDFGISYRDVRAALAFAAEVLRQEERAKQFG